MPISVFCSETLVLPLATIFSTPTPYRRICDGRFHQTSRFLLHGSAAQQEQQQHPTNQAFFLLCDYIGWLGCYCFPRWVTVGGWWVAHFTFLVAENEGIQLFCYILKTKKNSVRLIKFHHCRLSKYRYFTHSRSSFDWFASSNGMKRNVIILGWKAFILG